MKYIRKVISVLLTAVMLGATLTACADQKASEDDNTLTLTIPTNGTAEIIEALEAKFPNIKFEVEYYAGANTSAYLRSQIERGVAGDLAFYTTFLNIDGVDKYLVDLSGYSFVSSFDKGILSALDVDGSIYQIPGPIGCRYIAVNKTLFEENGWKIPSNFEEMVAVCRQIRREKPDIIPLGLGLAGAGYPFTLVTSYAQCGFLATTEGQMAESRYLSGEASFGEAFGEGLDMVGELIDAGAFDPEEFKEKWEVQPEDYSSRRVAMGYVMSANASHTALFNGDKKGDPELGEFCNDEYVTLPMFGRNEKNKGLILTTSSMWGINKKLEEKGNEKKFENALRVLEYISTEEGQLSIRSNPSNLPPLRNLTNNSISGFMRDLWNDNSNSIKACFIYTGYEHMINEAAQAIYEAMYSGSSSGMKESFIETADKLNKEHLSHKTSSASFAHAEDDLTKAQTRWYCCEAFRSAADADIAIASEGGSQNGIINKDNGGITGLIYKGDITAESIMILICSVSSNVVSLSMTGEEIVDMLNNGRVIRANDGTEACFEYNFSGMEVTYKNGKIASAKIGGRDIDKKAVYKVAMLSRDYPEDLSSGREITDTGVNIKASLENYFREQRTLVAVAPKMNG